MKDERQDEAGNSGTCKERKRCIAYLYRDYVKSLALPGACQVVCTESWPSVDNSQIYAPVISYPSEKKTKHDR